MNRKLSSMDFSYFISQTVKEIVMDKNLPIKIVFESAVLTIECPWRLQVANQIAIGHSDFLYAPEKYSYLNLEKILLGKKIQSIVHFEGISDLILEFEDQTYLELFHDSNYFEGWQLQGDSGFYLFTLPGGSYSS